MFNEITIVTEVFADNLKDIQKVKCEMIDLGFVPISNPSLKGNKWMVIMCFYEPQNNIN